MSPELLERQTNEGQIIAQVQTYAGAVPEPASCAMMIGGFGLVGGALRCGRAMISVTA